MELLSPAGNSEKLRWAYLWGADAAYIGLHGFSLRSRADNFGLQEFAELKRIKAGRRLYCALNIYFFDHDIAALERALEQVDHGIFDAFIVSDLGILPTLRRRFPDTELHLSTQANCVNSEAARFYRDLGFSRVVPGRELSLAQIAAIKNTVPDLQLEVFAHGAMCLAYSGRCFLSRWMSDRSANQGDCAHSCRWNYRLGVDPLVLEEQQRPGEYYPIIEADDFTEILSSRDLCMIDHLAPLRDAGVDSLKIEGRMKSVYYTAVVTRAYRAALDALSAPDPRALEFSS
ncbi:MAG: U32 family peptidase [Spirochaetaceae bacterium]|nr:MAG: U32 family peptidase [Spirochaetaceae bacterium]